MRMSGSRIRTRIQDPGSIVEVSNLTKELMSHPPPSFSALLRMLDFITRLIRNYKWDISKKS